MYEVKDCETKTFRLVAVELAATFKRAVRQGKTAVWLIHFPRHGFTLECKLVPDTKAGITE